MNGGLIDVDSLFFLVDIEAILRYADMHGRCLLIWSPARLVSLNQTSEI